MQPYPLRFQPILKQTIWGGRRLGDQLGKPIGDTNDYAESWEVVDHGDDQSVVVDGPLAGKTLLELIQGDSDWLLGPQTGLTHFPLLLKYLDCNRVLSVQVHPDDDYGAGMDPPDLGKTEAWYVVSSDPGSLIYAGLKEGVDQTTLREAVEAGQTEQVLHAFEPNVGDVVFIPAGTVHALGAGLVIAEIQQSSDTTFRLFDWNRLDSDGNSRPLHIEQSIQVSDYQSGPVSARRTQPGLTGWQSVVQCDKFRLRVMEFGSDELAGDGQFHIVTVPRGKATLATDHDEMTLVAGSTVLLPAAMGRCQVSVHDDSASSGLPPSVLTACLPS